jgi:hypothetical protein
MKRSISHVMKTLAVVGVTSLVAVALVHANCCYTNGLAPDCQLGSPVHDGGYTVNCDWATFPGEEGYSPDPGWHPDTSNGNDCGLYHYPDTEDENGQVTPGKVVPCGSAPGTVSGCDS